MDDDLNIMYKIRKTVLKMLEDRGYQVDQKMQSETFENFKLSYKGKQDLCILAQHVRNEKEYIYVECAESPKLGVGDIQSFAERLHEREIKTGILIIKGSITPLAKQVTYINYFTIITKF